MSEKDDEYYENMARDVQQTYLKMLMGLVKKYDGTHVASTILILLTKMIFDCIPDKDKALDLLCDSIRHGVEAHVNDNFDDKHEAMKELNEIMNDYGMPKPSCKPIDLRKFTENDT